MYGLPRQSVAQALADVECALALEPAHLSHYQLTLEPGTVFAGRPPDGMPDTDLCADMQLACQQRLAAARYLQYEVSAYARPGKRCRHNLNYWQFGDYLGIGAGAHGKCSRIAHGELVIERSLRPREPRRYLASLGDKAAPATAPVTASAAATAPATLSAGAARGGPERRAVPAAELPFEYLLNALRLNEGFEERDFEALTGVQLAAVRSTLEQALRRGLMQRAGTRWRATAQGFNFLNDLLAQFLPPATVSGQNFPVTADAWR